MDWFAIVCILVANQLMAKKIRFAWVVAATGSATMIIFFGWFSPERVWSVIILNVIFTGQSIYGYFKWKPLKIKTPESEKTLWHNDC